jgi:hypothetical protein
MEPTMSGGRDDDELYGLGKIAELWGVSESTARRWLALPEATCFEIGSMHNAGGGYGYGWHGQVNSLTALKGIAVTRTSKARSAAASARWNPNRAPDTAVSSYGI